MPPRNDSTLKTIADELVELVKRSKKISVEEAAKKLKMPLSTAQSLVDFLVEERIFGIEYKFTTPYIYLYKEEISGAKVKDKSLTKGLVTKDQFYQKAREKKVPYEYIEGLWRKYLQQNLTVIREEFLKKSREKGIPEDRIEELWNKYLKYL
jgi:phage antirepressor YoqD-like protein